MTTTPAEITVLGKFHKARDIETHVREINVDGVHALELRDYIPSSDRYGRGYWLPEEITEEVGSLLMARRRK